MPRASAAERETRDGLVLRLFLAGVPYRDIGKHQLVKLSPAGVHRVVKRQMLLSAERREYLADNALDVHIERLESLFAANYQVAINRSTDPVQRVRAGELCRRLLEQIGKARGLDASAAPPSSSPRTDDDFDGDPDDELTAWRKRRENQAATGSTGGEF